MTWKLPRHGVGMLVNGETGGTGARPSRLGLGLEANDGCTGRGEGSSAALGGPSPGLSRLSGAGMRTLVCAVSEECSLSCL